MTTYLTRRLLQSVVVLIIVTIVTFGIVNLAPGGPSILMSMEYTEEQRQRIEAAYGLDVPVHTRYVRWMANLVQGNLGRSMAHGRHVDELVAERLPNTMLLGACSLVLSVAGGLFIGVLSATRRYSLLDYATTVFTFIGVSIPGFWFALILIIVFAVNLHWLPSAGMATLGAGFSVLDRLRHLILPTIVMSTIMLPQVVRFTRSSMIEVLKQDYIKVARAKGLSDRVVIYKHALKSAMFPVITVIGLLLPRVAGGSVITEQVFAWPGMGRLAVTAALGRDYPVIMGVTVVIAAVVIASNLTIDVLYAYLDPRVTYD